MKISKNLPQFKDENSLIVVSSSQSAVVYKAHRGLMYEVFKTVREPKLGREGFFSTNAKGKRPISGSVYESKSGENHRDFFRKLSFELKKIASKGYSKVYFFIPHYLVSLAERYIPYNIKNIPHYTIRGNFINENPFKLLLKIKDSYGLVVIELL